MDLNALVPYSDSSEWQGTLNKLSTWLEESSPEELYRINVVKLSERLATDQGLLIDAFLAGVLEGDFDLRWDFHCPHCNIVPGFTSHMRELKSEAFCALCNVGFRNTLDNNIEVTFTATSKVAYISPDFVNQQIAAMVKERQEGTYTMPDRFLSGLDLIHRPLFRDKFSDDVLSSEETLEIKNVVILFTDIKGSTELYEQLGDAKAYNMVREHFKLLFGDIEENKGVVVKTIGDAVMASFQSAADALSASLSIHDRIAAVKIPGTDDPIVVKMGLHSGPAIVVNLNERLDYFGQSVNKAARIQGLAKAQELYFSEGVFTDPTVRKVLARRKASVTRWKVHLKGISDQQVVYSVK